ncbi:hypothetical protein AVEN_60042-1, partial [Araneus ventricosus]
MQAYRAQAVRYRLTDHPRVADKDRRSRLTSSNHHHGGRHTTAVGDFSSLRTNHHEIIDEPLPWAPK